MNRYICLLRSVNVSGVNLIKMTELKTLFEQLNFRNVYTYIQSGNIIFEAEELPDTAYIEEAVQNRFHTQNAAAILKTPEELTAVVRRNPFAAHPNFQAKNLYVQYLQNLPNKEQAEKLAHISFEKEFFVQIATVIYVYYETPQNPSKLSNAFFEKQLGLRATTRNWSTTQKLQTLAASENYLP